MERKSKQAFWTRHVRAFEASGQTRQAYCERHGLAVHSLDYWRGMLSPASGFAEFLNLGGLVSHPLENRAFARRTDRFIYQLTTHRQGSPLLAFLGHPNGK